jgi:predicted small integral membrane protein
MSQVENRVREEERKVANWSVWRVARIVASIFVLMTASYYLVVGFDNITNPTNPNGSNWPFVQGVLSGDGVPADSGFEWRFIDATWFQAAGYVMIMTLETVTGILLLIGGLLGLRRSGVTVSWGRAQRWTYAGGTVGLTVFFFGFITVGGNWFIMYLNSKWNGLTPAFQNSVMTALTMIFVTAVLIGSQMARDGEE